MNLCQRRLHRLHGLVSHAWQEVRVSIQGHGNRGVSEKLLYELRVSALREQERGARVPEIVEADIREPRPLE